MRNDSIMTRPPKGLCLFLIVLLLSPFLGFSLPSQAWADSLGPPRLRLEDPPEEDPFVGERIDAEKLLRGIEFLAVGVVGGLFWIVSLRRQVTRRTGQLRSQLDRVRKAEREIDRLNVELRHTRSEIAFTLGEVIESRSNETANHVRRVAAMTELLFSRQGRPQEEASLIGLASALHDIGKIAVPDAILNKRGRLTAAEFALVKEHTRLGHRILSASGGELFDLAATIALEHHEKWNGSGYPQGLAGKAISLEARVVAVVDVFDALVSRRVYKEPWPLDRVLHTLLEERGRHFDPSLVDLFMKNLDDILLLCRSLPDGDETWRSA